MMARLPFLTPIRLWAALLLAAIGLQAAEPVHVPLEQRHGSAFSAATFEVAVSARRADDGVEAMQVAPVDLSFFAAPVVADRAWTILPRTAAPRPDSTGPPLPAVAAWPPSPRGPPLA